MYRYYHVVAVGGLYAYHDRRCKVIEKGVDPSSGICWAKIAHGRDFDKETLLHGTKQHSTRIFDLGLEWEEHKRELKNRAARNQQARDLAGAIRKSLSEQRDIYVRAKYTGHGEYGEIVISGRLDQLTNLTHRFVDNKPQRPSALERLFDIGEGD